MGPRQRISEAPCEACACSVPMLEEGLYAHVGKQHHKHTRHTLMVCGCEDEQPRKGNTGLWG
eukprot:11512654-Alexandrium_andersonii.AAC.1